MKEQMGLDMDDENAEQGTMLDSAFSQKALTFAQKSITELEQFDAYFNQLQQNPAIKATLKSEVSRLNDLKNCDYHRAKTKQLLNDYHTCVEENLRLKEMNFKLAQSKKSQDTKYEVAQRKL